MTTQEVQEIIDRLCVAFRFDPRDSREFDLWFEHLLPVSYARADRTVRDIIRTNRFKYMPRIGEFLAYMDELSGQGASSASEFPVAKVDPYLLWRQDQIVAMCDEDYWQYMIDPVVRRQWDERWEMEWQRLRRKVG